MSSPYRKWPAAVLGVALATSAFAGEFPIGAWFPGLYHTDKAQWGARLDSVLVAGSMRRMRSTGIRLARTP